MMQKKKKPKKARLLSMDELKARPCEVDGRLAIFHRWIEEDKALLRLDSLVSAGTVTSIHTRFKADGVVPPGCSIDVIRETFALVEYLDGTIAKVDPLRLRFVVGKEGEK